MSKYLKSNRSGLSKFKRMIVGYLPRQFHCYCLGAEKTGTTSIHSMLSHNFRSGHEADPKKTLQLVIDYHKRKISREEVTNILVKRDRLLNLEMESAHHFAYICGILEEIFPEAKFIITIREPYNHLESRLNWHRTPNHPAWDNYIEYFIKQEHNDFEKEEILLKKKNLYSLDTYLKQYSDHYKRVLGTIPEEKRIIIKTSELDDSVDKIANFLNIKANKIHRAHANKKTKKDKILDELDQAFVRNKIWQNCNKIIKNFFPETRHLYPISN